MELETISIIWLNKSFVERPEKKKKPTSFKILYAFPIPLIKK